ncbi:MULTISPECIES: hypothetical protein [Acinetobacter]|nr:MULTISPECIES: hypothetical protein [Acinetobacter]AWA46639.1 hypothetical protein CDG57_00600 [Acinetobacter junii]OTS45939.1 hypothetical protein CAT02_11580 [Acinetobacter pittii]
MIDYDIYYRESLTIENDSLNSETFDIFISAFNASDRVKDVFNKVNSNYKYWLIHPEYKFSDDELNGIYATKVIKPIKLNEQDQFLALHEELNSFDITTAKICIDSTGFMRNVLAFLIIALGHMGAKKIHVLYSEPLRYIDNHNTNFSISADKVKALDGTAITPTTTAKDSLIMSIGFDHALMSQVVNEHESATFYPVYAFPSLSADMFQQSAFRSSNIIPIKDNDLTTRKFFAPANDPFSTAKKIQEIVNIIHSKDLHLRHNIYLCPLSTKAQLVGYAYYWWKEGRHETHRGMVNIVLPMCTSYKRETSIGLKRVWKYTLEM